MLRLIPLVAASVLAMSQWADAAPVLTLTAAGTAASAATISRGTAQFTLDLSLNSDGSAVSGLQYYLATTPTGVVKYAGTITPRNTPFTSADVALSPAAGATVDAGSAGTTVLFKSAGSDYAAFSGVFASYTFTTASLPAGMYVFRPVGEELSNATDSITTFGTPGAFTLTVSSLPEPSAMATVLLVAAVGLRRRVGN